MDNVIKFLPLALWVIQKAQEWIQAEKARTGKSTEEILASAGVQFEANQQALAADLLELSK